MFNLFLSSLFINFLSVEDLPPLISCDTFKNCLILLFFKILEIIVNLAIALAAIFITWGGIEYILYGAEQEKRKKAGQRLIWGMVGLVIALTGYGFIQLLIYLMINEFQFPPEYYSPSYNNSSFIGTLLSYKSFVYAATTKINEPDLPNEIKCGTVNLKSVLSSNNPPQGSSTDCLVYFLLKIISTMYYLALIIGIIFIVWAGILYITKSNKAKEIHSRLIYGIIGILIAILSLSIVKIIKLFFYS